MDSPVKIRFKQTGHEKFFKFSLAQDILIKNSRDFECIDDNHEFINNELIKRTSLKDSTKPTKPKPRKARGKLRK